MGSQEKEPSEKYIMIAIASHVGDAAGERRFAFEVPNSWHVRPKFLILELHMDLGDGLQPLSLLLDKPQLI